MSKYYSQILFSKTIVSRLDVGYFENTMIIKKKNKKDNKKIKKNKKR